ncbi:MAG: DEAD/DEAH box helicase [Thermoanaerobaculia bacterium]|nr:DEAD/DEAH box helicase [Thermoanaerobaculia bacterium]
MSSKSRSQACPEESDGTRRLALRVHPGAYAVCRMHPRARIPKWIHDAAVYSATRTHDELTLVAPHELVPNGVHHEGGRRMVQVVGEFDFEEIGVLASIASPLAEAEISIYVLSTFATDYLFLLEDDLDDALDVLEDAGHLILEEDEPAESAGDRPSEDDLFAEAERREADSPDDRQQGDEPGERLEGPQDEEETVRLTAHAAVSTDQTFESLMRTAVDDEDDSWGEEDDAEVSPEREMPPEPDALPADEHEEFDRGEEDGAEASPESEPPSELDALPADEREEFDENDLEEGMFTGAIPQVGLEVIEDTWQSLGLSAAIIDTIEGLGFSHPTSIQAAVIPIALEGTDIIGLAQTGSGKTAAFCLPLAERLTHGRGVRGLILCPTREIALQTKAFLDSFGRDHELETAVIIGGVKFGPQIQALRRKPDILVATPGRLADHMRRRNVHLRDVEELVLDEADHMLDLGFLPQIQEILTQVPEDRRTMMFSATMPPPIERLAQRFMDDPYLVDQRPVDKVASGIEHRLYLVTQDSDKKEALVQLLKEVEGSTLVFARRKIDVEWLARQLQNAGVEAERIHSDRTQAQRVRALKGFRQGSTRILAATDVAARGIDVPRLQHVVNYELPDTVEDYVHRAGRTARGQAVGIVSTIGTWQDKVMIGDIERVIGRTIPRHELEGIEHYKELKKKRGGLRRRRLL